MTAKIYEGYKRVDETIAGKGARDPNAKLQLNWLDRPTDLSRHSNGDCGGLGFTSTMQKKLGREPSNWTYQTSQATRIRSRRINTNSLFGGWRVMVSSQVWSRPGPNFDNGRSLWTARTVKTRTRWFSTLTKDVDARLGLGGSQWSGIEA